MKFIRNTIEKFTQNSKNDNVFIIPTKAGFKYVFINFTLFLIALTYANNLALLVSFFMVTYFILQMLDTHQTVAQINMNDIKLSDGFAGEDLIVTLNVDGKKLGSNLDDLEVSLEGAKKLTGHFRKQINEERLQFTLEYPTRGYYQFKRVRVFSRGNSGLFYVWRFLRKETQMYIYPEKKYISDNRLHENTIILSGLNEVEFSHHVPYETGMNSKRIDWKVFARTEMLYKKKHIDHHSTTHEINFNLLPGNKEEKLQHMSFLVTKYFKAGKSWRVVLPSNLISTGKGIVHYKNSMEVLSAQ